VSYKCQEIASPSRRVQSPGYKGRGFLAGPRILGWRRLLDLRSTTGTSWRSDVGVDGAFLSAPRSAGPYEDTRSPCRDVLLNVSHFAGDSTITSSAAQSGSCQKVACALEDQVFIAVCGSWPGGEQSPSARTPLTCSISLSSASSAIQPVVDNSVRQPERIAHSGQDPNNPTHVRDQTHSLRLLNPARPGRSLPRISHYPVHRSPARFPTPTWSPMCIHTSECRLVIVSTIVRRSRHVTHQI